MALDIGLATGLAYKHDFQKDIKNRAMIHQLKRQKKIDNENESRLWAKELETMAVQNPYDAEGLQDFLGDHYKKMGKWLQEHPNFRSNPQEFINWTNYFVKPIKDNEFVRRDLSFQEQKKLYSQHVAKYGKGHSKTKLMGEQMENYRSMGNIDGDPNGGIKEFMFAAPYDGFDPMKIIRENFSALQPQGGDVTYKGGAWWYNATYDEKRALASQLASDPNYGGMWDEWWASVDDSQKTSDDMIDHMVNVGGPFVTPKMRTPSKGSGAGTDTGRDVTIWDNDMGGPLKDEYLYNKKYTGLPWSQKAGSPVGINAILQNGQGEIDILDGSVIATHNMNNDGTVADLKFLNSLITGRRKATATGNVSIYDRGGAPQYMAEVEVFVGLGELNDMEGAFAKLWEHNGLLPEDADRDILDIKPHHTWLQLEHPDEMNDVEITGAYRNVISKVANPENPDELMGYSIKTWVPANLDDELSKQTYSGGVTTKPKGSYSPSFGGFRGRDDVIAHPQTGQKFKIERDAVGNVIGYSPLQ